MEELRSHPEANLGSNKQQDNQHVQNNTKTSAGQCKVVLEYMQQHGSITTLEARNELYIMATAARIFELKERGHNIHTVMVPATFGGRRKIARYVLMSGGDQ